MIKADVIVESSKDVLSVDEWLIFRSGTQLWKSNGTPEETIMMREDVAQSAISCNGQLYFIHAEQLWILDPDLNDAGHVISDSLC